MPSFYFLKNPSDDTVRGWLYSIAMGLPTLIGFLCHLQTDLVFVSLGAMFALRLDPRSRPVPQVLAIIGGMLLMLISATLGAYLVGHQKLSMAALLFISFLAGQPKSEQAYLSLLGKFIAAALVITEMGIPATPSRALAYLVGALLACTLTIIQDKVYPPYQASWEPSNEWHKLMAGDTNGPLFGLTLPLTMLAAMMTANAIHAHHPAWAGLTVLFVMHVNDAETWEKIRSRTLGTLLGAINSYIIILFIPIYAFAPLIFLFAFFMPKTLKNNYLIFSMLITSCVLMLINIATLHQGGDLDLIKWRLFDTLIGSLWVTFSLVVLRLFKAFWPNDKQQVP